MQQLLNLLRDHGSMSPGGIWAALGVSRQGAMDLLRLLLDAGFIEKLGGEKNWPIQFKKSINQAETRAGILTPL